jgi:Late competence development protein ComFB
MNTPETRISTTDSPITEDIYCNVMEALVAESVDRRLQSLPPSKASYVKRVQIITYALNRLPALYASSAEGVDRQRKRARRELAQEIEQAVNHALAAVQRDPLKRSTPLVEEQNESLVEAEAALSKIRQVFKREDLSWSAVANWVIKAVNRQNNPERGGSPAQEIAVSNRNAVLRRMHVQAQKNTDSTLVPGMNTSLNDDTPPISAWDVNNLY